MRQKPTKPQVILYARFSPRPGAEECDSIEKQLTRLRAWCVARDYEVVSEYSDADASGATTEGRDGLDAALKHTLKIRGVLAVYDISRLARRVLDAVAIAEKLIRRKCGLMFLTEQMDTSTPFGMLMFQIQAAFAEYFRRQNAVRTSTAMKAHQKNGRRMGRRDKCPFGWRPSATAEKGLEEDPAEQATIARIVAIASTGISDRAICRQLDAEGVGRRGKAWAGAHRLVAVIVARAGKS